MTDTAGASDLIFGLFWLLGNRFSPRIADAGESRFWRINKDANYGQLDSVSQNSINTKRIAQNWDDMLRVAGSLRSGKVSGSELIGSLLRSRNPSSLTEALNFLQSQGQQLHPEDIARLSPLVHKNLNVLGKYSFNLSPSVANGKMRRLMVKQLVDNIEIFS